MAILLYEPLADINRAPFIKALCCYLQAKGHQVVILVEAKVLYTLKGEFGTKPVLDNRGPIYHYLADLPLHFLPQAKSLDTTYQQLGADGTLAYIAEARQQHYLSLLKQLNPERIFIWNSNHDHQRDFMELIDSLGWRKRMFYAEMGWFPQKGHVFFDPQGVAGASEIAQLSLAKLNNAQIQQIHPWLDAFATRYGQRQPIAKRILVPLQIDSDSNITHFSEHFDSMACFVEFLQRWIPPEYEVIVRPHPLAKAQPITLEAAHFRLDSSSDLAQLLVSASLVIGLNSTVLLESLLLDIPTIAFARGVFGINSGIEASLTPTSPFPRQVIIDQDKRLSFLYELAFVRQLPLAQLMSGQGNTILERIVKTAEGGQTDIEIEVSRPNWWQRLFGLSYLCAYYLWQRVKRWR